MINQILAQFFAQFKTKNPTAYGVICLVLIGVYASLSNGIFQETFGTSDAVTKTLEYLAFAIAVLTGTHTTETLRKK
jgi:hypothetical protein